MPANLSKLEYRVWRQADEHPEIQQMKGQVTMAVQRLRVNAERVRIDPWSISTQVVWTGEQECRFTIEAEATEEALSSAWVKAAKFTGLLTEPLPTAA